MRILEFKGKEINTSEWIYGDLWSMLNEGFAIVNDGNQWCESKDFNPIHIIPETVCEYINYEDLNKEKLFTNDIIFYHRHEGRYDISKPINKLGVIVWDEGAIGFRIKPIDTHSYKVNNGMDGEKIRTSHRIIKVGNLFDNDIKELVEKYLG